MRLLHRGAREEAWEAMRRAVGLGKKLVPARIYLMLARMEGLRGDRESARRWTRFATDQGVVTPAELEALRRYYAAFHPRLME